MKFQPDTSELNGYSLDQILASQALGFGVTLLPLGGIVYDGEGDTKRISSMTPYGMMGVFREDALMPLSQKAVSAGFKTTSHYDTFKGNHEILNEAGFRCYKASSLGTNGGHAKLWYYHSDRYSTRGEAFPRYMITTLDSHFDGGGISRAGFYTIEAICANLAVWRETRAVSAGTKRTINHDQRITNLLGQVHDVFIAVSEKWHVQDGWARAQANAEIVKEFCKSLHPVTSLNHDGTPNKAAANEREKLAGYILGQAALRERPVSFEDLLQGVIYRTTHISPRKSDNETRQLERIESGQYETLAENWIMSALATTPREASIAMLGQALYAAG